MPEVKFDDVFNEMMKNDEFRAEYEALIRTKKRVDKS